MYDYDDTVNEYYGIVVNSNDIIHFHAETIDEIELAFKESVDSYLEMCKEFNREPHKSLEEYNIHDKD